MFWHKNDRAANLGTESLGLYYHSVFKGDHTQTSSKGKKLAWDKWRAFQDFLDLLKVWIRVTY